MGLFRSCGWARAAIVVPVAVLILLAGNGALTAGVASAAGASVPDTARSGLTWHRLYPINGWHAIFSSPPPSWSVSHGVVYLTGGVFSPSGTLNLFAELPAQARPRHALYITTRTGGNTAGSVTIYSNGKMFANSPTSGAAASFTSLLSISYPARTMAAHALTLRNGWRSSESDFNSGDPSYSVSGGIVYLSGSLHQASGTSDEFATLPKAARPAHVQYISVYTFGGEIGVLQIDRDGQMFGYGGQAQSYTSLAGLSYPAASTSTHKLLLLNGWTSGQGSYQSGAPAYRVSNGIVYLSGSLITSVSNTALKVAVLPRGARPAVPLSVVIYTFGGTTGGLLIEPNGDLVCFGTPGQAQMFSSLAAIAFPLQS
jgi:hypothetical protein